MKKQDERFNDDTASNAYTDAAEVSSKAYTDAHRAGRNILINGDFGVWQRGNNFATGGIYTADRWKSYMSSAEKAFDAPPGFHHSVYTTASVNDQGIQQIIEPVNIPADIGAPITFSVWLKTSIQSQKALVINGVSKAVNVTSTWQRFSFTTPIVFSPTPSVAVASVGNVAGDFFMAGAQLELGSVATPFDHRQYGLEFALCERYYSVFRGYHYNPTAVNQYLTQVFRTDMRTAPSATDDGTGTLHATLVLDTSPYNFLLLSTAVGVVWGNLMFDAEI